MLDNDGKATMSRKKGLCALDWPVLLHRYYSPDTCQALGMLFVLSRLARLIRLGEGLRRYCALVALPGPQSLTKQLAHRLLYELHRAIMISPGLVPSPCYLRMEKRAHSLWSRFLFSLHSMPHRYVAFSCCVLLCYLLYHKPRRLTVKKGSASPS